MVAGLREVHPPPTTEFSRAQFPLKFRVLDRKMEQTSGNILFVESSIEEQVEELAVYLDNIGENEQKVLSTKCAEFLTAENVQNAINLLLDNLALLSKAPEKEFEPVFNVMLSLLSESTEYESSVNKICAIVKGFSEANSVNPTLLLAVLSTLFNSIPKQYISTRLIILTTIVSVASKASLYNLLTPHLPYLSSWLQEAGVSMAEQRAFNVLVSNSIRPFSEEQSFQFLLEAVKLSEDTVDEAARDLVSRAINSPKILFYDDIVSLPAVQRLDQSIVQLLGILCGGVLEDYLSWKAQNAGCFEQYKLDEEALLRKMKLLTAASLATAASNNKLSYAEIAKGLQIDESSVELWIIDVIRAGLVEGRMSQLTKSFLVHRSSYRVFQKQEWVKLHEKLAVWKSSLQGMLKIMEQPLSSFSMPSRKSGKDASISVSD
ncbi:translation initiation factor eIF3m [Schizosaccharomyces japonicus yFS275]|uniref:Eukaryotic translation initiation factor 3 subunit M n=1 Tax=Schizosaccharomyces japonicus (strain yFS275 / FY16936) TaxID=402676 RepID=B6K815_SCHJY|nr:translation initiation factor eIF3m [Schizosaccharomyces japonicus yFS275]EEB09669.1 translation initiation factor eIF3m [Schizosaccharomyces japonicus yFS275]